MLSQYCRRETNTDKNCGQSLGGTTQKRSIPQLVYVNTIILIITLAGQSLRAELS